MSIKLGDNIEITGPQPNDARYLNVSVPWVDEDEVNAALLGGVGGVRYTGLTVNIAGTEYWYKDDILDACLIEKTSSGGGTLNMSGSTVGGLTTYGDETAADYCNSFAGICPSAGGCGEPKPFLVEWVCDSKGYQDPADLVVKVIGRYFMSALLDVKKEHV